MGYADALHIPFVAIIGENEIKNGTVTLKDMTTGEQQQLTIDSLIEAIGK